MCVCVCIYIYYIYLFIYIIIFFEFCDVKSEFSTSLLLSSEVFLIWEFAAQETLLLELLLLSMLKKKSGFFDE